MNPFPMLLAELRAARWTALVIILLVALASAVGVAIQAGERGLRKAGALAADDFPLLIGAPGSAAQLVLSTVFLRPEAVPLVSGAVLDRLKLDKRVRDVAPVAFGDYAQGYPIVGTNAAFAARWGRLQPIEGRLFAREGEAVIGAGVHLPVGGEITPSHGHIAAEPAEEAAHRHESTAYRIVGRLPLTGTPWDRAILVPIEAVWAVHGLDAHAHGKEEASPGVPAIVVRPRSIADAYILRGHYREGGTMAFFPAEVLTSLYGALGNVRDFLILASMLNAALVFAAIVLVFWAIVGLRRQRYAVLRALGASRPYIFLLVWFQTLLLAGIGGLIGLLFGWGGLMLARHFTLEAYGMALPVAPAMADILMILGLIGAAALFAVLPSLIAMRGNVLDALRGPR